MKRDDPKVGAPSPGIGCREFARIVGARYPEVSRAAAAGLITVVCRKGNRKGLGINILDREQALRIAAAVKCGIPWRVAAMVSDRITVIKRGGIRLTPPTDAARANPAAIFHRSHRRQSRVS